MGFCLPSFLFLPHILQQIKTWESPVKSHFPGLLWLPFRILTWWKDLTPAPSEVFLCKECHPLPWWTDLRWMTDTLTNSSYTFIRRLDWKMPQSSGLKAGDSRSRPAALSLILQRGFSWSQVEAETLQSTLHPVCSPVLSCLLQPCCERPKPILSLGAHKRTYTWASLLSHTHAYNVGRMYQNSTNALELSSLRTKSKRSLVITSFAVLLLG